MAVHSGGGGGPVAVSGGGGDGGGFPAGVVRRPINIKNIFN